MNTAKTIRDIPPTTGYRLPATGYRLRTTNSALRTPHFALRRRRAMTLVELLIVLAIIALLGGIGVAVGYKLIAAGDTEKTKARLAIIMNAVNDYYDDTGDYPDQEDETTSSEDYRIRIQRADSNGILPSFERFTSKLKDLDSKAFKADEPFVKDPSDASDTTLHYATFNFIDPSGNDIRYDRNGGLGGTPVLISPGRDKDYSTSEDNIRSDK